MILNLMFNHQFQKYIILGFYFIFGKKVNICVGIGHKIK
jgi:mannose/fructose/N-acetylgalactosamine-specific phosphotransferase system component IIC